MGLGLRGFRVQRVCGIEGLVYVGFRVEGLGFRV